MMVRMLYDDVCLLYDDPYVVRCVYDDVYAICWCACYMYVM